MLSRRNIRVKVLQTIYASLKNEDKDYKSAETRYDRAINNPFEVYLYNLAFLRSLTAISKEDEEKRKSKYLVNPEDLTFTAKLFNNPCSQSLWTNPSLNGLIKFYKLDEIINEDLVRKLYFNIIDEESYKEYVFNLDGNEAHKDILLTIYKSAIKNDHFNEVVEDLYNSWEDDKSLVVGAIKKTIKELPLEGDFHEKYKPDPEAVIDLGKVLLQKYFEEETTYEKLMSDSLENWNTDRLAQIDSIIIKLGIAEFLNIDHVPTHVTLNEYIELAKLYSTEKSGEFVNGVLDTIASKLKKEGKLTKE